MQLEVIEIFVKIFFIGISYNFVTTILEGFLSLIGDLYNGSLSNTPFKKGKDLQDKGGL